MAFRVIKQRREARRNAKLEEIFLERDKLQNETISCQDMQDVFRMYGVSNIMGHGDIVGVNNHYVDIVRCEWTSWLLVWRHSMMIV